MEHRFHQREAIEVEAVVFHRGNPTAICQTRDLSLGGAFIRTGPLSFCRHTPLELELALPGEERLERHRLPAFVVHSGPEGAGLMFLNIGADARSAIRRSLRSFEGGLARWAAPQPVPAVLLMSG